MHKEFDVIVVGAGMIGTTIACLLAKLGLRLALIDDRPLAGWSAKTDHPRVSAINPAVIRLLEHIDIWDSIRQKRISLYTKMQVWDAQTDAYIFFDAMDMGKPMLGAIVENTAIIDSALERLRSNYLVSVLETAKIINLQHRGEQVSVTLENNHEPLRASLVIGADGARSAVRELSTIETDFHDYEQQAIVAPVSLEKGHQETAWQCFTETGPIALLPLEDGRCSLVWSCDHPKSEYLMGLSEQSFCEALSAVFEHKPGKVIACGKRFAFPLQQRHAKRYFKDKCVLIGDAAHTTHPLAGQGANIGFMDAVALAEVIEEAISKGQSFNRHTVLRRYERWRYGENQLVLGLMKGLQSLFSRPDTTTKTLREIGVNVTDKITPVKYQLARYAMGLSGDLPKICRNDWF